MYQNCILVRDSKYEKAKAAKKTLAETQTQLPIVPDTICRDIADDVNLANTPSNKQKKKRK